MSLRILRTDWARHRAELMAIRHRVFVEEQGVPVELEHDAHDASALHLLALADGDPVGTARMLADGHIGRMAVLPGWRRHGIGTEMLRELVAVAAERGLTGPFLHAQCTAIPFYRRLGFVPEGGVFEDAGIEHRLMRVSLPRANG